MAFSSGRSQSSRCDRKAPPNLEYLDTIKRFLQVSPGSTVLLRGHGDNLRVRKVTPQGTRYYIHGAGSQLLAEYRDTAGKVVAESRTTMIETGKSPTEAS